MVLEKAGQPEAAEEAIAACPVKAPKVSSGPEGGRFLNGRDGRPLKADCRRRILIVRLSAIGDTVHSLFLADALKKLFPGCFLGWVVEEAAAPLIVENPLLDYWKVLPNGFLKKPAHVLKLRKELKGQEFEISFDPQSLSKSSLVALLSGAKIRIGFCRGEGRELAPFLNNTLIKPDSRHVVESTLELVRGLGQVPPENPALVLPLPQAEDSFKVDSFLREHGLGGQDFFLFAPGSAQASKRWPLFRYRELGTRLRGLTGKAVVLVGHGSAERDGILSIFRERESYLAPDLGLLGVTELIRRSFLTVGSDSFVAHVAAGLKVPTVMLFSVSDPSRVGPRHKLGLSVHGELKIVGSSRARRKVGSEFMESLSVLEVETAALKIIKEIQRTGKA
jgi:ADP-heptose:LPS heptosyltransferase